MKKATKRIILSILTILVILVGTSFFGYNTKNHTALILQFGEVVDTKADPGIFFKLPIIQKSKSIYVGENLYDVPSSEVITSDKKSMIANCYVTWQITDPKKYYQTLSSESVAQGRIDVAVYNAMKNVISSITQDAVISGKDGSLGDTILNKISMEKYGIAITANEIKVLDLPDSNKKAVYDRMISERNVIAAEYTANGAKNAQNIKSATDAQVRKLVSEAQVIAANTKAEGDSQYFKILADSYSSSPDRQEFYNFIIGLDAMKESLSKGGTITLDKDSPIYDILINKNTVTSSSEVTE